MSHFWRKTDYDDRNCQFCLERSQDTDVRKDSQKHEMEHRRNTYHEQAREYINKSFIRVKNHLKTAPITKSISINSANTHQTIKVIERTSICLPTTRQIFPRDFALRKTRNTEYRSMSWQIICQHYYNPVWFTFLPNHFLVRSFSVESNDNNEQLIYYWLSVD